MSNKYQNEWLMNYMVINLLVNQNESELILRQQLQPQPPVLIRPFWGLSVRCRNQ